MSNKDKIEEAIKRVQLFGLDADINTDEGVRHFHHGHEYVEIGGMKWATMNVGAKSATDRGLYFQWGDTEGWSVEQIYNKEKNFSWETYKYFNITQCNKYNSEDNKKVLDLEDDAVHTYWGGNWRMPTYEEFQELWRITTNAWTINYNGSGIKGTVFTSKEDSSIKLFFPSVGDAYTNYIIGNKDSYSFYWSSSLEIGNYSWLAFKFGFKDGFIPFLYNDSRCFGYPVRGIVG